MRLRPLSNLDNHASLNLLSKHFTYYAIAEADGRSLLVTEVTMRLATSGFEPGLPHEAFLNVAGKRVITVPL